jgi:choline-glycine betaine transporter
MNLQAKNTSLIILGITSLIFSRGLFALFNDPEGPNLLVVVVMALIVFTLTLGVNRLLSLENGLRKLSLLILAQVLIVGIFYFFLS